MQEEKTTESNIKLDGGTYEIIQNRLQKQKGELQKRLTQLNDARAIVFGSIETKLIANNRINTQHNCIARDIVTIGDNCIFGYNVHFGLRTEITLEDVFSVYTYDGDHFVLQSLDIFKDDIFLTDFTNLYKYYRNTIFSKFAMVGNYLHLVFQLSDSISDIKTFKWLIDDGKLRYVDNRSEHEFKFPKQHEFRWTEVSRDYQRYGEHPHISILDKVFVETIGGDLTIKIEDNTDDGKGIYNEPVVHADQTLDDGQYHFADLGNLIILDIKPFQEEARYFVYNHKIQEVKKINTIKDAVVLLPDDQGIVFPNGYYLQSGEFKIFDNGVSNVKFQEKISSPNGEDYFYVFYENQGGLYILMAYNVIDQEMKTPIICNGFTILKNGELCYFKTENEQTKHHIIQIWQTPFIEGTILPSEHTDSLLYKIGNKDIVKAMAECQALIVLLNKEDSYNDLYDDISKQSLDIVDSYYWIREPDTFELYLPLGEINNAANSAIDEFEKVVQLRKTAAKLTKETEEKAEIIFGKIKSSSFRSIEDFVTVLSQLRTLRGEVIGLREIRYTNVGFIDELEQQIVEQTEKKSQHCVQFLLGDKALLPYHKRVEEKQKALEVVAKVIDAKKLEDEVNLIVSDLEMLIDIVSNLQIEDTSHSTKIIDNISLIFATINQLKSNIKNTLKSLGGKEASADFSAQIKLIDQSIINYLDIADTPEKADDYLNKISIQIEELEGKFSDFENFVTTIIEKREEVYNAFEARKSSILEQRNKKALALENAAKRILKGIQKKAQIFDEVAQINGYFASDLMINKLRNIIMQLFDLNDVGKAEMIETGLKTAKEDAIRKLKDKKDLYEDGENVIKLGQHKFAVNNQVLDLAIVYKEEALFYHLIGTDFYQKIPETVLSDSQRFWNRELLSENKEVYRAAYLAYTIFNEKRFEALQNLSNEELQETVSTESGKRFAEGYIKGVHDQDALKILKTLILKISDLGLLKYTPKVRAYAQYFWNAIGAEEQSLLNEKIKASGEVLKFFPKSTSYYKIIEDLEVRIKTTYQSILSGLDPLLEEQGTTIATYLFEELQTDNLFSVSNHAHELFEGFTKTLKSKRAVSKLNSKIEALPNIEDKINLALQWVSSYISAHIPLESTHTHELVCILLFKKEYNTNIIIAGPNARLEGLSGQHETIVNGTYDFNFHDFTEKLELFSKEEAPAFEHYRKEKHEATETFKAKLRLEEFKPRVLSSFIRNKLIDKVYLPLFGDNFAKQLGTIGDAKRTDRMGMLLLISPPGYGKTTLMEYLANRLGLIFMKINGPAIGHEITALDPMSATNIAAKGELKKLNLAFEMGNNVMLYLDDIQHCNSEFLQKFISLADGTRKIEGVYNDQPRTYDFRNKKLCVVMAGNPYTESGEKFQIPDMLANRADIYNLGDIIGDSEKLFRLSLIENSLTSNTILHQLSSSNFNDVYQFIDLAQGGDRETINFEGNHTKQEINDYVSVLEKVLIIKDRIMKVNAAYIASAAMDDAYRTEPSFKLQGSYRDMNKLVAKVVPVMNTKELETLLLSHYENESQTLTNAAEANLLKYKEIAGILSKEEKKRWESLKETYVKNNKIKSLGGNHMSQVIAQIIEVGDHLSGIQKVLKDGLND